MWAYVCYDRDLKISRPGELLLAFIGVSKMAVRTESIEGIKFIITVSLRTQKISWQYS